MCREGIEGCIFAGFNMRVCVYASGWDRDRETGVCTYSAWCYDGYWYLQEEMNQDWGSGSGFRNVDHIRGGKKKKGKKTDEEEIVVPVAFFICLVTFLFNSSLLLLPSPHPRSFQPNPALAHSPFVLRRPLSPQAASVTY